MRGFKILPKLFLKRETARSAVEGPCSTVEFAPLPPLLGGSLPRSGARRIWVTALLTLTLPATSIAQTPRCITQGQAAALVTFALPSLVEGVAQRCERVLGPNAYLTMNAAALSRRYTPDADAAWPLARRTIAGFFEPLLGQPMPDEMNSDVLRTLLAPMLGKLLAKAVNIGDCGTINGAITQAAPLPGHNLGELAAMAAMIADRKDKGIAGVLHICRPDAPRPDTRP